MNTDLTFDRSGTVPADRRAGRVASHCCWVSVAMRVFF